MEVYTPEFFIGLFYYLLLFGTIFFPLFLRLTTKVRTMVTTAVMSIVMASCYLSYSAVILKIESLNILQILPVVVLAVGAVVFVTSLKKFWINKYKAENDDKEKIK